MTKKIMFAAAFMLVLLLAVPATADDTESRMAELQNQVNVLMQQNQNMEERIRLLEDLLAQKVAPGELKTIKPEEVKQLVKDAQEDADKKEREKITESVKKVHDKLPDFLPAYITRGLEYHGYFRSGYGLNSKGGKMEAFQAPDAPAKYRLGNEQETYIEAVFLNKNWNPDPEGIIVETQIRLSYQTQQNQSQDLTNQFFLREMFGRMGNFVQSDPEIKVWGGERFYRLPELEINDFWWSDMSGYGGGFEDIDIGPGKLAIAYIGYSANDVNLSTDRGRLAKSNLHFMVYDVDVPYGKATMWVNGGFVKGGIDTDNTNLKYPDMGGVDVGVMHYIPGDNANNQFSAQFGCGANTSLSAGANLPTGGDDRKSWRVRLTDMYNKQVTDKLCLQAVGVFQLSDYGHATKQYETWLSAGVRPVYMFDKHFGIEFEPGIDYINNPRDGYNACLYKVTGGFRITPGVIFDSRPVFRLFATYARWTDGFKGNSILGGNAYTTDSQGLNFGVQCESWW
ncbi:MAG: carbohydrate porin [Candidatus Omnitrophota bacterium]